MQKPRLFNIKRLPMDIARIVCIPLFLVFRIKKITPDGKPYKQKIKGGAIIAANHSSFADPFIVGVTFWYRRLFFLMAEVVMGGRLRSTLLKGVGGIKIDRGTADIEAIKKSVGVLKDGHLLSVFPQGGIIRDGEGEALKSGSVLMAMQADVPIIPIYICKRKSAFERVKVIVGSEIRPKEICPKRFPSTQDMANVTEVLAKEMQMLSQINLTEATK